MKCIIVNSSSNFEYRADIVMSELIRRGFEAEMIASDFDHAAKKKRSVDKPCYHVIETVPYRKNISIQRLYSHRRFSADAFDYIKDKKADILWLTVPQNSNAEIAGKYRKLYPDARIIIDIVDLWPESMPLKNSERWPFSMWAYVRNHALKDADRIVLECELYHEKLGKQLAGLDVTVMPWLKRLPPWQSRFADEESAAEAEPDAKLRLFYLGAINNIIDIPEICSIISCFCRRMPVSLDIIGTGERAEEFVSEVEKAGAEVVFHGPVYDERRKQEIMDSCDYGLNIMRDTVCVGISMKSIDYLAGGLPVINNLPGDIRALIESEGLGFNVSRGGLSWQDEERILEAARRKAAGSSDCAYDRKHIRKSCEEHFSADLAGAFIDRVLSPEQLTEQAPGPGHLLTGYEADRRR